MKKNPSVNRYLTDKTMDRIDHALGRPVWPLAETYRDHFVVSPDSDIGKEMAMSPHWHGPCGKLAYFYVTKKGRAALADHLKKIGDPNRAYDVTTKPGELWDYAETYRVVATNPSEARNRAFLDTSEFMDVKRGEFQKSISVRLATAPKEVA